MLGFGTAVAIAQIVGWIPLAQDASVYYAAQPGQLYDVPLSAAATHGAYLYSPAFADLLAPVRLIPLRWFTAGWQLMLCAVLAVVLGRWSVVVLGIGIAAIAVPSLNWLTAVAAEVAMGNIQILLAAVAVFGLRYPGLWSIALLTKMTPGVGLVWFVARREWRNLAVALGLTAAIALASLALLPGDWPAWVRYLANQQPSDFPLWVVPIALPVRLAMSTALIWFGGRTNRPWIVPIGVGWAIPLAYPTMLATMVGALAYFPRRPDGPAPETGAILVTTP